MEQQDDDAEFRDRVDHEVECVPRGLCVAPERECERRIRHPDPAEHMRPEHHPGKDLPDDCRLPDAFACLGKDLGGDEHDQKVEQDPSHWVHQAFPLNRDGSSTPPPSPMWIRIACDGSGRRRYSVTRVDCTPVSSRSRTSRARAPGR